MGLEEILESRDTPVPQPEEPANTTNGKRKRKPLHRYGRILKFFRWLETRKKDANV